MIANLRATTLRNQDQDWLKSNLAKFTQMLQGQRDLDTVCNRVLSELAQVVFAHYGAFYILKYDEELVSGPKLKLFASYAHQHGIDVPKEFAIGEGLIGQCAWEKGRVLLTNIPKGYINITSGLGKVKPSTLIILPVLFENNVKAVIELASLQNFNETHLDFLGQVTESIGIVLNNIEANNRTEKLLTQSQSLAGELKIQQEELRRTNDELQDNALLLVKQKEEVEAKNNEVEEARRSLEEKAEQLTLTSKYKSEFLANMSHELRTPLNSLLILAQQLYENAEGNLTEKQTRYAKTIHSCGDDLIQLINDILDLSKIESGFISTHISSVPITDIAMFVETTFKPIAEARNLRFKINVEASLPEFINSDIQRLNQILKNLLSNAFKFTEKGEVTLKIFEAKRVWEPGNHHLDTAKKVIAFSISDTGIGITPEKQMIIFEAFQQAEGSTSRKYGGTGLGLSISRGLAELLGGSIELESTPSKGSTFTLFLPIDDLPGITVHESQEGNKGSYRPGDENGDIDNLLNTLLVSNEGVGQRRLDIVDEMINQTGDDRTRIGPADKVVLVVEDDFRFGKIIIDEAHDHGMKVIIATNYLEVFDFINRFSPIAITLDIKLNSTSGWKVLDLLRNDLNYRHIPVHVISGEENRQLALRRGARNFLLKPVSNEALNELFDDIVSFHNRIIRKILVVEDNDADSSQIVRVIQDDNMKVSIAQTGSAAFEMLQTEDPDCIILDYSLPDVSGTELLNKVTRLKGKLTPVIVYSARDFNGVEAHNIGMNVNGIIQKSVDSIEQLLEATVAHIHINHKDLSNEKRRIIESIRSRKDILNGKKILVVDDDVRNLFALTTVFERYNINVTTAESGKDAIALLNANRAIEMVLIDIMMPEMDGYETMQKIRREHTNSSMAVIAVTAKAMKGDRQKCIEAGASDYITKPLKIDQLLALMRLWFYK
jgi:signal transduction histidine kinase/CheY-like chemotaxis protein